MDTENIVKGAVDPIIKGTVEPIINTVDSTVAFGIVKSGPFAELAFGMIVLVVIIVVHGWSMAHLSRRFAQRMTQLPVHGPTWRVNLLMGWTIALLALTHLVETLMWSAPLWYSGLIENFRDSYFFVLETYTTLGDSNIALPEAWRLIGPMIAISGLFTFSWTGSVLVYVVGETGRRHAAEVRAPSAKPRSSAKSAEQP